ncbi:MAG: NAD(P)H-dependent oxidoreductase [Acetatifactor sp.]|nr:NAD(P)H-dependent oxidoreductase [Acetatifactor sp.]
MKVVLINASPRNSSSSASLLESLKRYLDGQIETVELHCSKKVVSEDDLKQLRDADRWVIACPLYVDGIPGHFLSCMKQIADEVKSTPHVYGIINCGFYEGIQTDLALEILENWCCKSDYSWGGGVGVGGGGALASLPKLEPGVGPKAPVDKALKNLAETVLKNIPQKNEFVSLAFPRFLYKLAAQWGWRGAIKTNGGCAKDLNKRLS